MQEDQGYSSDESSGNLYSGQAREIMEVFQELHKGGTTIIQATTHTRENADFGTRLINLIDGRIEKDEVIIQK